MIIRLSGMYILPGTDSLGYDDNCTMHVLSDASSPSKGAGFTKLLNSTGTY